MTIIKKKENNLLSFNLVWTIVGDNSVNIFIQKCESFWTTQELVRGVSGFFISQYVLYGSIENTCIWSLFERMLFWNHFYDKCFLQYFEGFPRVSSFHPNNLDKEACYEK